MKQQEHEIEQYLTFILGDEEYGVNILSVQEIRGWTPATPIPNSPDYVLGVVNLRGVVVPVIDLRKRFSLESAEFNDTTVIVIVKTMLDDRERTVGMVVDTISDVYDISRESIYEAPEMGSIIATDFISGLTNIEEKMLILLDINLLVNSGVLQVDTDDESDEDTGTARQETVS